MPTPVAHGVAAWAAVRTAEPAAPDAARLFALAAFLAIAPDLDFVPGILVGRPGAFHRGPTHSLAGGFLASLAVAGLLARLPGRGGSTPRGMGWWFGIVMPTYCAHIVLDLVVPDTRGATGMPLFWPVSDRFVATPMPLPHALRAFIDLPLGSDNGSFLRALLSGRGLAVLAAEGILFTPLLFAPRLINSTRARVAGLRLRPADRRQPEA